MKDFKQLEREVVKNATLLDIELDNCTDPQDYNDLLDEYRDVIEGSNYFTELDDYYDEEWWEQADNQTADIYEENGMYGVRESSTFTELPPIYDSIEQIDDCNLLKVCYNGKYGLMEFFDGMRVSVPLEYDSIHIYTEDELIVIAEKDGKFQYQRNGESEWVDEIIMPVYAGWVRVRQGNRTGWLDTELRVTYDPSEAHEFAICKPQSSSDVNMLSDVDRAMLDRWTDWEERFRTSPEELREAFNNEPYFFTTQFYRNPMIYPFEADGKMGVRDHLGFIIVPAIYDEVDICNGLENSTCHGRLGDRWGMVVNCGSVVRNPKIEMDEPTHWLCCGNLIVEKKNGKFGLYDKSKRKYLLEHIFDEFIEHKHWSHIITRIGNKYGYLDFDLNYIVFPQFDDYRVGRCLSYVRFRKDGKWGYINEAGAWTDYIEEAEAYTMNTRYFNHV